MMKINNLKMKLFLNKTMKIFNKFKFKNKT